MADATITVAQPIAYRYKEEFGFDPVVIMNAPEKIPLSHQEIQDSSIKLIDHGGASSIRNPELMIKSIARCTNVIASILCLSRVIMSRN